MNILVEIHLTFKDKIKRFVNSKLGSLPLRFWPGKSLLDLDPDLARLGLGTHIDN